MIRVRPTIFCFLGQGSAGLCEGLRRELGHSLGEVPDVFAFVEAGADVVRLRVGRQQEERLECAGAAGARLAEVLAGLRERIGRRPSGAELCRATRAPGSGGGEARSPRYVASRAAPETYFVQRLSGAPETSALLATLEALRRRARGLGFPLRGLFGLVSGNGAHGREAARRSLRWLEISLERGLLFSGLVLSSDCAATEMLRRLSRILVVLCDAELADRLWLSLGADTAAAPSGRGLAAVGMSEFRLDERAMTAEISSEFFRQFRGRLLGRPAEASRGPSADECRAFLGRLLRERSSRGLAGRDARKEIVDLVRQRGRLAVGRWGESFRAMRQALGALKREVLLEVAAARRQLETGTVEPAETPGASGEARGPRSAASEGVVLSVVVPILAGAASVFLAVAGIEMLVGVLAGALILVVTAIVARELFGGRRRGLSSSPPREAGSGRGAPAETEEGTAPLGVRGASERPRAPGARGRDDARAALAEAEMENRAIDLLDGAVAALERDWKGLMSWLESAGPRQGESDRPAGEESVAVDVRGLFFRLGGDEAIDRLEERLVEGLASEGDVRALAKMVGGAVESWPPERLSELGGGVEAEVLGREPGTIRDRLMDLASPLGSEAEGTDVVQFRFSGGHRMLARGSDLCREGSAEAVCIRLLGGVSSRDLSA